MICPYCGQQIETQKTCPHCGNATVFANRINYQTVGTSENVVQLPSIDQPTLPLYEREREIDLLTTEADDNAEQTPSKKTSVKQNHPKGKYESGQTEDGTKLNASVKMLYVVTAALLLISVFLIGYLIKTIVLTPEKEVSLSVETDVLEPIIEEEPTEPVKINFDVMFFNGKDDAIQKPEAIALKEVVPLPCNEDIVDADGMVWVFTAWNTAQDGSGVSVPAGIVFPFSLAENVTLYAQWEKKAADPEANEANALADPAAQIGENAPSEKDSTEPAESEAS